MFRWILTWCFFLTSLPILAVRAQHTFSKTTVFDCNVSQFNSVAQSPIDTSIVSVGNSEGAFCYGCITKMSQTGAVRWTRIFPVDQMQVFFHCSTVLADGSIIASGFIIDNAISTSTLVVLCLNREGDLLWNRQYTIYKPSYPIDQCVTKDGGAVITGVSGESGFILKTDSLGMPLWCHKTVYGVTGVQKSSYYKVVEDRDSTLVFAGAATIEVTGTSVNAEVLSLLRLEKDGKLATEASYLNPDLSLAPYWKLGILNNGSLLVHCLNGIFCCFSDVNVLRWARRSSPGPLGNYSPYFFHQLPTGDIITMSGGDSYFYSFDTLGNFKTASKATALPFRYSHAVYVSNSLGEIYIIDNLRSVGSIFPAAVTTLSTSLVTCTSSPDSGSMVDIVLYDTAHAMITQSMPVTVQNRYEFHIQHVTSTTTLTCGEELEEVADTKKENVLVVYPNPVSENSVISITIPLGCPTLSTVILRDLTGREVYRSRCEAVAASLQLPTAGLAGGAYMIELLDAANLAKVWQGKIVIR